MLWAHIQSFQLEIITRSMISAIQKFQENILESSSETLTWLSSCDERDILMVQLWGWFCHGNLGPITCWQGAVYGPDIDWENVEGGNRGKANHLGLGSSCICMRKVSTSEGRCYICNKWMLRMQCLLSLVKMTKTLTHWPLSNLNEILSM